MRTGHETDAMFQRYDITDNRDKVAALEAVRNLANQRLGDTPNSVSIRDSLARPQSEGEHEQD